ncbi:hypothetical protein DW833_05945 [Anaerobutyricum hallii]|uniref:Uncharacterized protein n=1 Tax=Anaerobutyricum hallii TaxID=39488 RepID=A0A374NTT6_9FIRM|nr:hypothetical protein DXD91_05015 [Anaerobutyricum hallii]RHC66177.1 hypothetical protein DW833_05945 [Anaerobutyricum hallii]
MNVRLQRSHPNLAPRPQICFIYLQDFCLSAAQEISWRDLGKKAEDTEISRKLNSIGLIHKLLS